MSAFLSQSIECGSSDNDWKTLGLNCDAEVRKFLGKRKNLETKLNRSHFLKPTPNDYMEYINNEKKLLEIVKLTKEKKKEHKKYMLEIEIAKKVHNKYQELVKYFGEDMKHWYSYIDFVADFAPQHQFHATLTTTLVNFIDKHQYRPELCKLAATWFYDHLKNADEAHKFLMRGLQYNKKNVMLYSEAFHLELKIFASNPAKPEEGVEVSNFKQALVILETGLEECQNEDEKLSFVINLLNIAENYERTWSLQKQIVSLMKSKFSSKEELWDELAAKMLEGKEYEERNVTEKTIQQRMTACVKIYETAIEKLQSKKMWTFYLDRIHKVPDFTDEIKLSVLKKAHQASNELNQVFLDERHYLSFIKLSPANKEEILRDATIKVPHSVELWYDRMCYYIMEDNENNLDKVFREGIAALKGESSLPLWMIRIQYLLLPPASNEKVEKIKRLYEEAYLEHPEISDIMIGRYLEWSVLQVGSAETRKVYLRLISQKQSLEIHIKMFELESMLPKPNTNLINMILDVACSHFGKTSRQTWLCLARFTKEHNPAKLQSVFDQAVKTLVRPEDVNLFKIDFSRLNVKPAF